MRRVLAIVLVGALSAVVLSTLGKAVLFRSSKGTDRGTPSASILLPLPTGVDLVANQTFESKGNSGGGRRVLVVRSDLTGARGPEPAVTVLDALVERGWRRVAATAAISPDGPCATADTVVDYLADPERPVNTKQFLRDLGSAADGAGVVTASFC